MPYCLFTRLTECWLHPAPNISCIFRILMSVYEWTLFCSRLTNWARFLKSSLMKPTVIWRHASLLTHFASLEWQVFAFLPKCCMLRGEGANTYFKVYGLTQYFLDRSMLTGHKKTAWFCLFDWGLMPLSTIFSVISWWPVLLVEEAGVPKRTTTLGR